jgi:hypothetical protein
VKRKSAVAERLSFGVTIFAIGCSRSRAGGFHLVHFANNIFNAAADGGRSPFS